MQIIEETLANESSFLAQLFNHGARVVLVIGVVLAVLQQVALFAMGTAGILQAAGKNEMIRLAQNT